MATEALHRLAAAQQGLFTRRQALDHGLTARQVDHGATIGRWTRPHRNVFRMAGAPPTDLQSLLAVVLACGPGAVASHRAAAWLWGMVEDLRLDVSGPLRRALGPAVTLHPRAASDLRPVVRRGIPCTDPLRTLVDLASIGDRSLVDAAVDRGVALGLVSVRAVTAATERRATKGRTGVALLRECLADRLDGTGGRTSDLESAMDRVIVRHRLPRPDRQYPVSGTRYRLDYAWPVARLAVEVDGYEKHSALDAFRSDRSRQNALVLGRWTVLRFTDDDVRRRPDVVAEQIRAALAA